MVIKAIITRDCVRNEFYQLTNSVSDFAFAFKGLKSLHKDISIEI